MMREVFHINPNVAHLEAKLKRLLENFDKEGEILVEGGRNVIKKIKVEDTVLNVKRFKTPSLPQAFIYKFFRKSKAERSFEYATKLLEHGILTPEPIAYLEKYSATGLKESFYVSVHLDYDLDFRVLNHTPNYPEREKILRQFAAFTFQLHENGINFLDHSPGNTLIVKNGRKYDFYLIDLNRMRFEPMNFDARMKNFQRLWPSTVMTRIMADEYAKLYGKSPEETTRKMMKYSRDFQRKKNARKLRKHRKNK